MSYCLYVCMFVSSVVSVCLHVILFVLSVCLYVCIVCIVCIVCMSYCLYVCMFVSSVLSVCLHVILFVSRLPHRMDDLCHVVRNVCKVDCVRLVAGIFLDVSFSVELRSALLKHKKHGKTSENLLFSFSVIYIHDAPFI